MYLENIFGGVGDIKRHLPNEGNQFDKVNKFMIETFKIHVF
jgi:hypothetical protein